jgi:ribosome recycling factor
MSKDALLNDMKKRMDGSIANLEHDLKSLRTGRASPNILDSVVVEAYGDRMPLSQLATVTVPEPKMISVQVWDKSMVKAVEKAIANADLGLNPAADGQLIRIILPPMSEERRNEIVKVAYKYGESSKIAIRNIRRDILDEIKKMEKDSILGKDEAHSLGENVQKVVDDFIKKVDTLVSNKEKEIMQI